MENKIKAVKVIGAIKKLNITLPRSSLLAIYKSFIRPHVDYNQPNDDKKPDDKSSHRILTANINSLKIRNDLNRPYFEYLKVIIFT